MNMYTVKRLLWGTSKYILKNNWIPLNSDKSVNLKLDTKYYSFTICQIFQL